jgi:hypothetical protein
MPELNRVALDKLGLPTGVLTSARILLEIIEHAETPAALNHAAARADGFFYGLISVGSLDALAAHELDKLFKRAAVRPADWLKVDE